MSDLDRDLGALKPSAASCTSSKGYDPMLRIKLGAVLYDEQFAARDI